MTRKEHLDWCKERALEYAIKGDLKGAWTSMVSDLSKHPETAEHPAIQLGTILIVSGHLSTAQEMTKFINDFN